MGLFSKKPESVADPFGGPVHPILVNDEWRASLSVIPDPQQHPVYTPIGDAWGVAFGIDGEGSYQYVTAAMAEDAGWDPGMLLKSATENLVEITRASLQASGDRRYRLELPGNEDLSASLILILPLLLPNLPIEGEPVVAIGSRAMLHVCGTADAEGVESLRELTRALYEGGESKPVTPELYTLTAGVITPLT